MSCCSTVLFTCTTRIRHSPLLDSSRGYYTLYVYTLPNEGWGETSLLLIRNIWTSFPTSHILQGVFVVGTMRLVCRINVQADENADLEFYVLLFSEAVRI
ncbi:MAG: hypothetical protein ACI87O_002375 [Planctomycetota bacterium]|jgi:hypothetical protein